MKKVTTVLTVIVILFATSAFANDGDNVTAKVAASFKTDFFQAIAVNWQKNNDFYFASFQLNNITVEAAYNEDGTLLGTSRNMSLAQLPLNVSLELTKKYTNYKVGDQVAEITFEGQTNYYLTVENDKQVLRLKCYSNGDIDIESKTKKEVIKG